MAQKTWQEKAAAQEKREAAAQAKRREQAVLEFQAKVAREREQTVVARASDLLNGAVRSTLAPAMRDLVWNALDRAESAREDFARQVSFLAYSLADANKALAEGRYYAGTLVQGRGNEVDAAYARCHVAREHAREVCRTFDIYCAALYDRADATARATRMSYVVAFVACGDSSHWRVVHTDAEGVQRAVCEAGPAGSSSIYGSEEEAWLTVMRKCDWHW